MSRGLRIGTVPYVNAVPLVGPLEQDPPFPLQIVRDVPSRLLERLLRHEVEAALVSSIACLRRPELTWVPGVAIGSRGPVQSIKLFARVSPDRIRTLALDRSSLTSVALVQILLRERYGVSPETVTLPPDLPVMLAQADAAVLIGDPGLASDAASSGVDIRWQADPGEEWFNWTGLPFVFALWVCERRRYQPEWAQLLQWAKERGVRDLDHWAQRAAEQRGLPLERCRDFLRHNMHYDLGPEELQGLERFRELAARHGFLNQQAESTGAP